MDCIPGFAHSNFEIARLPAPACQGLESLPRKRRYSAGYQRAADLYKETICLVVALRLPLHTGF